MRYITRREIEEKLISGAQNSSAFWDIKMGLFHPPFLHTPTPSLLSLALFSFFSPFLQTEKYKQSNNCEKKKNGKPRGRVSSGGGGGGGGIEVSSYLCLLRQQRRQESELSNCRHWTRKATGTLIFSFSILQNFERIGEKSGDRSIDGSVLWTLANFDSDSNSMNKKMKSKNRKFEFRISLVWTVN